MPGVTMKRRYFYGAICEQIVYRVPCGVRDPFTFDEEKPKRPRFKDAASYDKFREEISRKNHVRLFHANFGTDSIYSTQTFDDDCEVHTFEEARKIRRNFVRALKRACPDAVIFVYMGRGKTTNRIHFHTVSRGVPQEVLEEKWKYGRIRHFSRLRAHNFYEGVDRGQDYTGLANYLFDHWKPEQGGHRWYATRNARKPEKEEATLVKVRGEYTEDRPPRAPKGYRLVEAQGNAYGYIYFKYVAFPEEATKSAKRKTGAGPG